MLVTMTHPDRPGDEVVVEQVAFRYAYFPEGWVSADDPDWAGAGVSPPILHSQDQSLHGGGQTLFTRVLEQDDTFTATGFNTEAIVGLSGPIPNIDRDIWLHANVRVAPVTTTSTLTVAFSPVAEVGSLGALDARGARTEYSVIAVGTNPNGRPVRIDHLLPAGQTAQDWCVVGVIDAGATSARVLGVNLAAAYFWAETG